MSTPPNPPERIRKLKALADDVRAPQGERDAARAKLEQMLHAMGITEEQLSGDYPVIWDIDCWTHEQELFQSVVTMILDSFTIPMAWQKIGRNLHRAAVKSSLANKVDIIAAYEWYADYLRSDRHEMSMNIRSKKEQVKDLMEDIKVLQKGKGLIGDVMITRYKIYPPSFLEELKQQQAVWVKEQVAGSDKPAPKPSRKEMLKWEAQYKARQAARDAMTPGEEWQKGEGLSGSQRELGF